MSYNDIAPCPDAFCHEEARRARAVDVREHAPSVRIEVDIPSGAAV